LRVRICFWYLLGVTVACGVATAVARAFPSAVAWPLALLGALGVGLLLVASRWRSLGKLDEVECGLGRFTRADWAFALDESDAGAFAALVRRFNALGTVLRDRQRSAEQSEQLLHTLIDAAPMAILLLEDAGEIEYANETARLLFFEGREGRTLERVNFLSMLGEAPAPLREAVLDVQDRLFTVDAGGTSETYHLAKRHFELHGKTHTLLMVKHLTRELRRQELDIWKKLIRVVGHELNNSLAPISSLVHSARLMLSPGETGKFERVFSTIEERARHLQDFVESYARFARLPNPRRERVDFGEFLAHIRALVPEAHIEPPPTGATGYFDRSQLEQVIINLLKNASEAGGPTDAVTLEVRATPDGSSAIVVADRGPGMSQEVLENAMLPFYSTKERGSGLGLALCREIVDAHGGTIRIENRAGAGLEVTCVLPGRERVEPRAQAKLTLSRM
jgi:two-component system nitrogen regulation sensor histidine kinase NtrY